MGIDLTTLAKIAYFKGLSREDLEEVKKSIAFEKTVEKGETFLYEGEQYDYIYFIVSGVVKVFKRSANGKEQILSICSVGESLNDVSTFDGGGCATNMLAMTQVSLYTIRKNDMEKLFFENNKVARNVARELAARVRRDSSLVEVLSFDQVVSRLAKLLLKQFKVASEMLPRFTQQDLASMVGTSRVVVNRSLRILEEKRAIRLERRRIVILNEDTLKEMVVRPWQTVPRHD
jgi:CRP-like cAMP-binding protein